MNVDNASMEQGTSQQVGDWPARKIILATLAVLAVIAGIWILFRFRLVFFSLFTAIVLSTAVEPLVKRLVRWGISRTISVILISLVILLMVIVLILTLAPLLIEQWATITSLLSGWYRDLRENLLGSPSLLIRRIIRQMPVSLPLTLPAPDISEAVEGADLDLVQRTMDIGTSLLRSVLTLVAVLLLTGFWTIDGERATRIMLLAFPTDRRENIRSFIQEMYEKVGAYTRGLVVLSLIIGAMATVAYILIGLPNVLFLGIIAGIMEAVPLVGPLLGAIPALLVALSYDPSKAIWVIIATMVFQTLENNLIVPRVMDRAVGVNPVASLLAFIAFGSIFGFTGALLAIPLAAVIQLILRYVLFDTSPPEQQPYGRDAISALRYEAQDLVLDVRKQVRDKETGLEKSTDMVEDAMESIVQDLDSILAQVETSPQKNGDTQRG